MRGIFSAVIIELPQPQQVWSSGEFSEKLSQALTEITGTKFRVHVTAGAALAVPERGPSPVFGGVTQLLDDIVQGRYCIPEHRRGLSDVAFRVLETH